MKTLRIDNSKKRIYEEVYSIYFRSNFILCILSFLFSSLPMWRNIAYNPANIDCASATEITTNGTYTGNTSAFAGNSGDNSWLTANGATVENIGYYKFTATSTTVTFKACTSCNSNGFFSTGIQFFIFKVCGNSGSKVAILKQMEGSNYNGAPNPPTIYNYGTPTLSASTISNTSGNYCSDFTLSGLTIGETYYWGVDGFNGKNCGYSIEFTSGIETTTTVIPSVAISGTPASICVGSSTTFTAIPTNGGASPTYQWQVNGVNVNGQNGTTFTTSTLNDNDVVSVILTSSDPCASPTTASSSTSAIPVSSQVTPTFTNPGPVCSGVGFTLPTTSTNNISGTWSPAVNPNATTTYTFTPAPTESCATSAQMTVTVSSQVTPTFTNPGPVCSGVGFTLPTTSTNNISGTWSPAVNPNATTTYTFTPAPTESCATSTQMTVTVSSQVTPTFTNPEPVCSGVGFTLPTTSTNNISGTWSPAVNPNATTTYTFTPAPTESCATSTQMTVTVSSQVTPTFTNPGPVCSGVGFTLPTTSTNNISGTWSPAVNPNATTTYTFTPAPTESCATSTYMTVTVSSQVTPTFTNPGPVCAGLNYTLPSTSSNNVIGTWSPSINSTSTTEYTFTPLSSQSCASVVKLTVSVYPIIPLIVKTVDADCEGKNGSAMALLANGLPALTYVWSNGSDSSKAVNLSSGTYLVTATDVNHCKVTKSFEIKTGNNLDVDLLQISNVITANGDQINDEIKLPFSDNPCLDVKMLILNRWGTIVYEMDKDNPNFYGKDKKGKMLTEGIYFYQIISPDLECGNGKNKCTGFIHVITK